MQAVYYDSSDEGDLRSKVLPVDDIEDDFDFSIPPTSGQEYLRRVIHEAKNCPDIVVADITSKALHKPSRLLSCASLQPAPQGYTPSLQWQKQQVADFAEVRQKLSQHKSSLKNGTKSNVVIPLKENINAWCALCFGRLGMRSLLSSSSADGLLTPGCSQFLSSDDGSPPLLSIVTRMDQQTVNQVLDYHVEWFEKIGFTMEQGQWFYALLACLEKPLLPESCALLRNLVRHCASLRASLESADDHRLVALNLIVCLVARYFDQLDLGDNGS